MERKAMKRVNIVIEADLYDKARALAFVRRKSISEIVRTALKESLARNMDPKAELLVSEKDERKLLKILESDEFVPAAAVKKSLGR